MKDDRTKLNLKFHNLIMCTSPTLFHFKLHGMRSSCDLAVMTHNIESVSFKCNHTVHYVLICEMKV